MDNIFSILGYEIDLIKVGAIYPIFNDEAFIVVVDGKEVKIRLGELDEDEAALERAQLVAAWKTFNHPEARAALFLSKRNRE